MIERLEEKIREFNRTCVAYEARIEKLEKQIAIDPEEFQLQAAIELQNVTDAIMENKKHQERVLKHTATLAQKNFEGLLWNKVYSDNHIHTQADMIDKHDILFRDTNVWEMFAYHQNRLHVTESLAQPQFEIEMMKILTFIYRDFKPIGHLL